jgi:HSP20 family protein
LKKEVFKMPAIERWNPFQELETMRSVMDRWVDRWTDENVNRITTTFSPAVDVLETENGYELHANLPGFKPEEVELSIDRDTVTLRAQHEEKEEKKHFLYRERRFGSFYRSLRLPEPIDSEKAEARVDNGVVTVTLPRLAQTQSRKLEIKANN